MIGTVEKHFERKPEHQEKMGGYCGIDEELCGHHGHRYLNFYKVIIALKI